MTKRTPRALRAALFASAALGAFAWATECAALPTGGTITGTSGGGVTITNSGTTTTVASSAHRALIDWTTFNVAPGETVAFTEPDKDAIIVNRELTGSMYINGVITTTVGGNVGGNVWFIDPNGIVFGPNANVNVGGILATTSNLVSDSAFLSGADTDPIGFSATSGYAQLVIDAGANITVHDGSAVFIGGEVLDSGTVTGAGSYATDTKAVFASARNFTVRFGSNPPDPLRATDLALFDLSVTAAGNDVAITGGTTTAGQVIFDDPVAGLPYGVPTQILITGADVDAVGHRGDGFDLVLMSGDFIGDVPVGGGTSSASRVTIGNTASPTQLTSAGGGFYVSGGDVVVNQGGQYDVTFDVFGPSTIMGTNYVRLNNIGSGLAPDVVGGSIYIDEAKSALTVGNLTGSNVTIQSDYSVQTGAIAATQAVLVVGNNDIRTGAIDAGTSATLRSTGGYVETTGPITAGTYVNIRTTGSQTVDGLSAPFVELYSDANLILTGPVNVRRRPVPRKRHSVRTAAYRLNGEWRRASSRRSIPRRYNDQSQRY